MTFPFPPEVEAMQRYHFSQCDEKMRRQYAAIEAVKLGHGGVKYISDLLGIDPKTIRTGIEELEKKRPS